jgi:hypothetical protein
LRNSITEFNITFLQFLVSCPLHHKPIFGKIKEPANKNRHISGTPASIPAVLLRKIEAAGGAFVYLGDFNGFIAPTKANYNLITALLARHLYPHPYIAGTCALAPLGCSDTYAR